MFDRRAFIAGAACVAAAGAPIRADAQAAKPAWASRFEHGLADWGPIQPWGQDNHGFVADPEVAGRALRVRLREGSIDPGSMSRRGLPRSGTGFKARLLDGGADSATLSYRLRFADNFDFVRGGKLPGLYGGLGHSGGKLPDGRDGFSLRLMWRERGAGEVYAYLPDSKLHGSSLLRGALRFVPGRWHRIEQSVRLNTPGQADGVVSLRQDGREVGGIGGLRLRDDAALRIDGVFVDVFFGGSDDSWAARADTHIDFAEFELRRDAP
jgi:hypothetical protein